MTAEQTKPPRVPVWAEFHALTPPSELSRHKETPGWFSVFTAIVMALAVLVGLLVIVDWIRG